MYCKINYIQVMIMVKNIAIFYFSGTKVTEIIAKVLSSCFSKKNIEVSLFKVEDFLLNANKPVINNYDLIGVGFPVHAFNAPKILFDFLKILPEGKEKNVFIFKTAGSDFIGGGTNELVKDKLLKKNYTIVYEKLFILNINFIYRHPDEKIKELYNKSLEESKIMVDDILNGNIKIFKNNIPLKLFSFLISSFEGLGTKFIKFHFYVSKNCNNCKTCINICPRGNIYEENGKIKFKMKCIICMRCFYVCPKKAISMWGFKFVIVKNWVDMDMILKEELGKLNIN